MPASDKLPIETFVKLLAVDPVKGDATARLEFVPHSTFAKEDGTLTENLKLHISVALLYS